MASSDTRIVVETKNCIEQHGASIQSRHIGNTEHPKEKLVNYGMDLNDRLFICLNATYVDDAQNIVQYLITKLSTDGNKNTTIAANTH